MDDREKRARRAARRKRALKLAERPCPQCGGPIGMSPELWAATETWMCAKCWRANADAMWKEKYARH